MPNVLLFWEFPGWEKRFFGQACMILGLQWLLQAGRAMDYFEKDAQVDAKRVALLGVSRLGKTVLWTGAHDERFAAVIASCGGEGGAALSRRNYGETVAHLVAPGRYPYQFAANYQKWAGKANESPVEAN